MNLNNLNDQTLSLYKQNPALWNDMGQEGQISQGLDVFAQSFQNLVGRAPTNQEINDYATNALYNAWMAPGDLGYSDASSLANNYIQNQFSPQIAQNAQQQQANQLKTSEQQVQDVVNQTMNNTAKSLTDPNSQVYQTLAGSMNNLGITPGSGAFQAGAGSTVANAGLNAANAGLSSIGIPAISSMQNLSSLPLQTSMGNMDLSHLNSLQDFGLQSSLGQLLAEMSQPSTAQKDIGMAAGAGQAIGGLGQGIGGTAGLAATSYICKELIKRRLICDMDMDDFHVHIMPAIFKKGRAFWKYAADGWRLVEAVNSKGLDWKVFKPLLFDRVMEEKDPHKAVDLYADACHQLCISCDRSLWDERVYRTSFLDSLPFLPRLLVYPPFVEALAKCLRIKMMFLYDKPRCYFHGS